MVRPLASLSFSSDTSFPGNASPAAAAIMSNVTGTFWGECVNPGTSKRIIVGKEDVDSGDGMLFLTSACLGEDASGDDRAVLKATIKGSEYTLCALTIQNNNVELKVSLSTSEKVRVSNVSANGSAKIHLTGLYFAPCEDSQVSDGALNGASAVDGAHASHSNIMQRRSAMKAIERMGDASCDESASDEEDGDYTAETSCTSEGNTSSSSSSSNASDNVAVKMENGDDSDSHGKKRKAHSEINTRSADDPSEKRAKVARVIDGHHVNSEESEKSTFNRALTNWLQEQPNARASFGDAGSWISRTYGKAFKSLNLGAKSIKKYACGLPDVFRIDESEGTIRAAVAN